LTQLKKFFANDITQAIHDSIDNHATITYVLYEPLQKKNHPLTINISKLYTKQANSLPNQHSSTESSVSYSHDLPPHRTSSVVE
jgi:hypothetical protein